MQLIKLTLHNFRCFEQKSILIDAPLVIIEGVNGSGKSSIIEALSYCCYLRSFRTSRGGDLARLDGDGSFFVKLFAVIDDQDFALQVGVDKGSKRVKINDKTVSTYKDILKLYRVVALAEHDLALIAEGPDVRRSFLNQYCLLTNPMLADDLKQYKKIVVQRNTLLGSGQMLSRIQDQLAIWSEQLYATTLKIERARCEVMQVLQDEVNALLVEIGREDLAVTFTYEPKRRTRGEVWEDFWGGYQPTLQRELIMRRTLFGAHLDDMVITVGGKPARMFASRGQQKLLLVLLKIAQVRHLERMQTGGGIALLLDDFLTDFDAIILQKLLTLISSLSCQVIITSPIARAIALDGAQIISV